MKQVARFEIKSSLAALVVLLLLVPAAWGQRVTGSIIGTVTDPSGAVVPDASVITRNVATNLERSATTDAAGFYRIDLLPIGTYAVTVEASGFRREILTDISLQIDQVARIDVALQVGELEQEVVVTSAPPLVDTSSAAIGDVIENKRILDMPLNGRNFQQLAMLTAGTSAGQQGGTQEFFGTAGGSIGFAVSGGRDDQNHFLIDGITAMDHYFNSVTITPSIDAVAEFKVLQNSYSSEYGMFGAGQVSVTTKSGTNEFHGSVFEFHRNHLLDARNFFDFKDRDIPPFIQNQFGASVGGPIAKDKTFFFLSYEGMRVRQDQTVRTALPTVDQRNGIFPGTLGVDFFDPDPASSFPFVQNPPGLCTAPCVQIPSQRFGTVANRILQDFFPVPNLNPNTPGLNHVSVDTRVEDRDQILFRFDHQFSQNHMFFGRYIWARSDQSFPFGDNILTFDPAPPPGFPTPVTDDSQNLAFGLTSVLGPNLVNELRGGWNFYDGKRLGGNRDVDFATDVLGLAPDASFGIPAAERDRGFPNFHLAGISQFGDADVFNPLFRKNNSFQFSDNLAWTKGRHSFKFGGNVQLVRFNTLSNFFGRGFPNYDGVSVTGSFIADFLIDRPFAIVRLNGDTEGESRTNLFGVYFNDEFRITPRFTMTYGLRYEVFPPIYEKNNRLAVYDKNTQTIIVAGDSLPSEATDPNGLAALYNGNVLGVFGLPPVSFATGASRGLGRSLTKTDWTNFAPRLGLAYDLTGKGTTVLRTAYGIYNAMRDWSASSDSRNMLPFALQSVLLDFARLGFPFPPITFDQMFVGVDLAGGTFAPIPSVGNFFGGGIGPQIDMPIGYIQQYTLNLQHQIGQNMSVEVAYVGSTGIHLNRLTTTNQERLTGPTRAFPDDPRFGFFIQEASEATSSYHSGFIRVEKRLSQGLMFVSSYTFSKSIDTVSSARENGGAPTREQDAFCLRCERALSNFDSRHRSITSFTYELPVGAGVQGAAEKFLKGWQLSGILTFQSGQPFTPQWPGGAPPGNRFPRPNQDCDPNLPSSQRTPERWFDTTCFIATSFIPEGIPALVFTAFPGNSGRNSLEGPGFANVDINIQKTTSIGERTQIQFRAEFFNFFNHANFKLPDRVFVPDFVTGRNVNPNFGQITEAKSPRVIQFGLKIIF
jgi:hypothetical protein